VTLPSDLHDHLVGFARQGGSLTVLTGAGISAESGIPTFRGPEGYWTIGSTHHQPTEMATNAMFRRHPEAVWSWYLHRLGVCRAASPNAGHRAVVALEQTFGDAFRLITQNVDGLHTRAGSSLERTHAIHGNLELVRCAAACSDELLPFPDHVHPVAKGEPVPQATFDTLVCPRCGARQRPHVLWFDETYDETWFRWNSSLSTAETTDLLITVGTSGATNLPTQVVWTAARHGAAIVDVNPTDNPFADLARRVPRGWALPGAAGEVLPALLDALR